MFCLNLLPYIQYRRFKKYLKAEEQYRRKWSLTSAWKLTHGGSGRLWVLHTSVSRGQEPAAPWDWLSRGGLVWGPQSCTKPPSRSPRGLRAAGTCPQNRTFTHQHKWLFFVLKFHEMYWNPTSWLKTVWGRSEIARTNIIENKTTRGQLLLAFGQEERLLFLKKTLCFIFTTSKATTLRFKEM